MKAWLAPLLLLAACGPQRTEEAAKPEPASSVPAATPAPPVLAAEPVATGPVQKTIPEAFRGRWDGNLKACSQISDMKLTVTETGLKFWESSYAVIAVTPLGDNRIKFEGEGFAEGEPYKPTYIMELSPNGETLTIGGTAQRVRCTGT